MRITDMSRPELEEILSEAVNESPAHFTLPYPSGRRALGLISIGNSEWEQSVSAVAATRLGATLVPLYWPGRVTQSGSEMVRYLNMLGSGVDMLMTSLVDSQTFGAGRMLTERLEQSVTTCPLLSLKDDIYNHLLGLSYLAVLYGRLGGLTGRRLVVAWGFGSQFSLPNVAHSIVSLASILGVNVRIVSPAEFSLLRRVIRVASRSSQDSSSHLEETHELSGALEDADAVVAFNWCRLDDFNDLKLNEEFARDFREWYFSPDDLPANAWFMTEPHVQEDLLATRALLEDERNITTEIFRQSVRTLCSLMMVLTQHSSQNRPAVLI